MSDKTNWERCQDFAASVEPEALIKDLLRYIAKSRKSSKRPLWSHVGMATNHGSGFSQALVQRFLPDHED